MSEQLTNPMEGFDRLYDSREKIDTSKVVAVLIAGTWHDVAPGTPLTFGIVEYTRDGEFAAMSPGRFSFGTPDGETINARTEVLDGVRVSAEA